MKAFLKVIVVFLVSFCIGATAIASDKLEQSSVSGKAVAQELGAQATNQPAQAEETPKRASKRSSGLFRVVAGVVGFGAIIAAAVTNSPADAATYVALSIAADHVTKKEDDVSDVAVRH